MIEYISQLSATTSDIIEKLLQCMRSFAFSQMLRDNPLNTIFLCEKRLQTEEATETKLKTVELTCAYINCYIIKNIQTTTLQGQIKGITEKNNTDIGINQCMSPKLFTLVLEDSVKYIK